MLARMDGCDVLVLGAGVAGLAAALDLAAAGRRVTVLEARDRIGGRIFTRHTAVPVELGAEFIHGLAPELWRMLREAALSTYELDGTQLCFDAGMLGPCGADRGEAFALLDAMTRWVDAHPDRDESFASHLHRAGIAGPTADRASAYVEGFNAADRNVIGIEALAKQQRAEEAIAADRIFRIEQGYDALPRHLAERLLRAGGVLHTGAPVDRVSWGPRHIRMSGTRAGAPFTLQAAQAVITLPLGVLHAGRVVFEPAPAAILEAARRLAMGPAQRMTLEFRSRFWADRTPDLHFLFAENQPWPTWWTAMPGTAPTITAWAAGPKALQLAAATRSDPQAMRRACLGTLAEIFGLAAGAAEELLVGAHWHDWSSDPYACGAYSYAPAGALDASGKMAVPVLETLYFAGEHTDTSGHWGTVHGALRSGLRAAAQCRGSG